MDHPMVTKINKTGYPNLVAQPEHAGMDYFDDEILDGDAIVIDEERGNVVLEENLEDYLIEVLGFRYATAK